MGVVGGRGHDSYVFGTLGQSQILSLLLRCSFLPL